MSKSKQMAGMRDIEHVAMTVPYLDTAYNFLEEVMGCQVLFSDDSFGKENGVWLDE